MCLPFIVIGSILDSRGNSMDNFDAMMAWEDGTLSHEDTVKLFQNLIDNRTAWTLQGCYGRQAAALIDSGECHR